MQLATIRIHDTEILSLVCPRLDAQSGLQLISLVMASVKRGARNVVLDLGSATVIDFAGARAIEAATRRVSLDGTLVLAGLSPRARAFLHSVQVAQHVRLVEWWTEAVETVKHAA